MKGKYTPKIIKDTDWRTGLVPEIPGTNGQAKTKVTLTKRSASTKSPGFDNGKN
jgi:hypothetical protein